MNYLTYWLLILMLAFQGAALADQDRDLGPFRTRIAAILRAPALRHAQVGLIVKDLKRKRIWFQQNADLLMMPASNMKLLTAACALQTLGPDHRLETRVVRSGTLKDGILTGDLYLQGGGDPALKSADLHDLAQLVRSAGVREIRGNLRADDSLFDTDRYNVGWSIDDLGEDYAMPVGALALNRNVVHFQVTPSDKVGGPPLVHVEPPLSLWTVINEARTVATSQAAASSIQIERDQALPLFWIRGSIPLGTGSHGEDKAVLDPAEYALNAFAEELLDVGVEWHGGFGFSPAPPEASPVAVHQSPPLRDLITFMNKESDNHTAEQLLKLLGALRQGAGTEAKGAKVVREWLRSIQGDDTGLVMADGSGLSRRDYVTPQNLLRVLETMAMGPFAAVFRASLPVAGQDGTLKDRLQGTPAAGRLLAKTGTMSHVSALSGYLRTDTGAELAVVIIMNGFPGKARDVRAVQDSLVKFLASERW